MPLSASGVLIGTRNHWTREDPNTYGCFSHGTLDVDPPAGQYAGAVDVSTPSGITVYYRLVRPRSRPALTPRLRCRSDGARWPQRACLARLTPFAAPSLAQEWPHAILASGSSAATR